MDHTNCEDGQTIMRAVEILVNPTEDGTRFGITAQSLTQRRDYHVEILQKSKENLFARQGVAIGKQQWFRRDLNLG